MPKGVPISVATTVMTTLPKIALASPPALPGGGVDLANVPEARDEDAAVHTGNQRFDGVAAACDDNVRRHLANFVGERQAVPGGLGSGSQSGGTAAGDLAHDAAIHQSQ